MRGPAAPPITLTDGEREELARLIRRHTTSQQIARRARMILAAATGADNCQIARELGVNNDTVSRWRRRWIGLQAASLADLPVADRLSDVPRPGRPSQITAEQTCQIIALACAQPADRPISHWTGREVADEVVKRGILPKLSGRHAKRLLKRGTSNRTSCAIG
jgi:putative transposase